MFVLCQYSKYVDCVLAKVGIQNNKKYIPHVVEVDLMNRFRI